MSKSKPDLQKSLLNESNMNQTKCIYNESLYNKEGEENSGKLYAACAVAFIFLLTEIVMGLISGSLAILSDAAHMFSDIFGFAISIVAINIAKKKATDKFSFGYQRAEILGALGSIILIWCLTVLLIYQATVRIYRFEYVKDPLIMLITAGLGLFFNIVLAKVLHGHHGIGGHNHDHGGHGHGHSHGHDHGKTETKKDLEHGHDKEDHHHDQEKKDDHHHEEGEGHHDHDHDHHDHKEEEEHGHGHSHEDDEDNINVRAAVIHVIGDIIQSIGVLIAALFIYLFGTTDEWNAWHLFDPICTYIFCILVMFTTRSISVQCVHILMEGTPMTFKIAEFEKAIHQIPNIGKLHNLHVWNINDKNIAMIAHVKADKENHTQILTDAKNLAQKHKISNMTIQIEEKRKKVNN